MGEESPGEAWRNPVLLALGGVVLLALLTTHPVALAAVGVVGSGAAVAWIASRVGTPTIGGTVDSSVARDGPDEPRPTPLPSRPFVSPDGPDDDQQVALCALSDSELCWAWRNSYFAAHHAAGDPDRLDRIARTRRAYLDEIQRRDPAGFDAWLTAGVRAASNPARYWRSDA